jgi:hypothetical protein
MERRRSERFEPDADIYARIKSSIPVRIVDVSKHGMKVESTSALPPSGECDIWLPTDDGDVRMRIRVQRCRARFMNTDDGFRGLMYHAGLEFLDLDELAESALKSIVEKLEGGIDWNEVIGSDDPKASPETATESGESRDRTAEEKGHQIVSKAM